MAHCKHHNQDTGHKLVDSFLSNTCCRAERDLWAGKPGKEVVGDKNEKIKVMLHGPLT